MNTKSSTGSNDQENDNDVLRTRRSFIQGVGCAAASATLAHFLLLGGKIAQAACYSDTCTPPTDDVCTWSNGHWVGDLCPAVSNGLGVMEEVGDLCALATASKPEDDDACHMIKGVFPYQTGDECNVYGGDECDFYGGQYYGDEPIDGD